MAGDAPRIFVSYSHRDRKVLDRLRTHLKPAVRDGDIDLWDDSRLRAGDLWKTEIDRALANVAAAVLLVSADFLASDFIHEQELPPIFAAWEQRGVKVYWVLLSACDLGRYPSLRRLQAVTVNSELKPLSELSRDQKEKVWAKLAATITEDLKNQGATTPPAPRPVAPVVLFGPEVDSRPKIDDGAVPMGSPYYVERDADRRVLAQLAEPGATVTVKGHGKSGKSSLLVRLGAWARKQERDACLVDFQGIDGSALPDPPALFREIASVLADRLGLGDDAGADWSSHRTHKKNLSRFVERRVLTRHDRPVLLLFDGTDLVFPHRTACEDLFSTLRSWHNERANDLDGRGWDRLGLVVAHATDPALWVRDLNQSPFNVGLRVVLDDFDTGQVAALNERYSRPLRTEEEVGRLLALVGGHPYLVRLALYELAARPCSLDELERVAAWEDGPFASPLRFLTGLVRGDAALRLALQSILDRKTCDDESLFQRLWAVGLIRGETRGHIEFRCRLYEDVFRRVL